jgi:hypothetical protein
MKPYYWKRPIIWAAQFDDANSIKDLQNVARTTQFTCTCDAEGLMTIQFNFGESAVLVRQGEWLVRNENGEIAVMDGIEFLKRFEAAK